MSRISTRFRKGTRSVPQISEQQFDNIECRLQTFPRNREFKIAASARAELCDMADLYCRERFLQKGAPTSGDVKKILHPLSRQTTATCSVIENLFKHPDGIAIESLIVRCGSPDLEDLARLLHGLHLACLKASQEIKKEANRGNELDEALEAFVWRIASLFKKRGFGRPTTDFRKSGNRATRFVEFIWQIYICLPKKERPLKRTAFEERVHRARERQDDREKEG